MGEACCHFWSWRNRYSYGAIGGFNLHVVGAVQRLGRRHPVPAAVLRGLPPRHEHLPFLFRLHSGSCTSRGGWGG